MKQKFIYSFKEINYGSISIESENEPSELEVSEAIMNGGAYINNTYHEAIELECRERVKQKPVRPYER